MPMILLVVDASVYLFLNLETKMPTTLGLDTLWDLLQARTLLSDSLRVYTKWSKVCGHPKATSTCPKGLPQSQKHTVV